MNKRIKACLFYGFVGCFAGLLHSYRWGFVSQLGFYPDELCNPKVADLFFKKGGSINSKIIKKLEQDSHLLTCTFQNAVKHQSLTSLQPLIDSGVDVNVRDKYGMTALFYVKSKQLAQLLIDNGADIEARNNIGKTPISYAENREIAQLLTDNGADVNALDRNEETPLFSHVGNTFDRSYLFKDVDKQFNRVHNIEVAKFLIEKKADINARNYSGRTPLFLARNKAIAQLLINNGADIEAKNDSGHTPLFTARTKEIAQLLIDNGADVNSRNSRNETPLFWARNEKIIKVLIDNGADVNTRNNFNQTALMQAVSVNAYNHSLASVSEIVKVLAENGADINARNQFGQIPLFATTMNQKIARILIDNGADVNARDQLGQTPLFLAVNKGLGSIAINKLRKDGLSFQEVQKLLNLHTKDLAQTLIENGADVNARDNSTQTPLFYAKTKGAALVLIENGANVDARDEFGNTPLFEAKSLEVAQILISHGADVNAKNNSGRTPLSTIETSLEVSQEQLKIYSSLPDDNSYKTEQIADEKQSIIEIKKIIELLVNHGGIN